MNGCIVRRYGRHQVGASSRWSTAGRLRPNRPICTAGGTAPDSCASHDQSARAELHGASCLRRTRILRSDRRRRAKDPHAERHTVGKQTNDRTRHRPHGHIVQDPAAGRRCFIIATPRGRSLWDTLTYSGLIPAAFATFAHFAVSVRMKSANSSGVFVTASVPIAA